MRLATTRFRFLVFVISLGLPLISAGLAQAQLNILAQYSFDTAPAAGQSATTGAGFEAQTVDPNAIAADLIISDNLIGIGSGEPWIEFASPAYPTPVLRIPPGGNSTNAIEAVANGRYIEISVFPSGGKLNLNSLTFDAARGGASTPRGWALLAINASGVATYLDDEDVPFARPRLSNFGVDLSGSAFQGLSQITFRIYTFSPAGGSSIEYDNITLYGTVQ